jgi:copper chaperone
MMEFKVSGMTCQGCINAVNRAIQSQDADAIIKVDLSTQMITVDSTLNRQALSQIILDAGFPMND